MSNIALRKRRHTTSELATITGQKGELFVDVTKSTLVVHDGTTAGGIPLAKEQHTHAAATESVDGFLSASDKTKLDSLNALGGLQLVQSNAVPLPAQTTLNFSTDFAVTNNPANARTDVAMSAAFQNEVLFNSMSLAIALS